MPRPLRWSCAVSLLALAAGTGAAPEAPIRIVLFVADGHDRTSAELPPDEKDAISHRGQALRSIAPVVAEALKG